LSVSDRSGNNKCIIQFDSSLKKILWAGEGDLGGIEVVSTVLVGVASQSPFCLCYHEYVFRLALGVSSKNPFQERARYLSDCVGSFHDC
jgi:hypothetical protein